MPFANQSSSADTEYLSDGITETLISNLSQLPKLDVKSRSAVFRYKGTNTDPQQIAKELNVQAILNGRVAERDGVLSLYVELVRVAGDNVIWSHTYDRQMTNLVALQSEIARDVSANLQTKLSAADEKLVAKNYTQDSEAYQLYLKGRYEWNKHTPDALQRSIRYYEQALEKDPNYALAYVGLSACYGVLGSYLRPADTFPKAKMCAQRALSLDDSLAEAHTAMAAVDLYFDWNWTEAEKELQRARDLNPNDPDAHMLKSDLLLAFKRLDEARVEVKRAQELDPLSRINNSIVGANYYYSRRYDDAITELEKTIKLDLAFSEAYLYLGESYGQEKKYDKAIDAFQRGMSDGEEPMLIAARGYTYASAGQRRDALQALDQLHEMEKGQYVSPYQFAVVYAGLGDKTRCLDWLEKAYEDRSVYMLWMNIEPQFDALRNEPRFIQLVQRMNLP
jgi:TolB-like protein/Flp pilus assembly protein TadD